MPGSDMTTKDLSDLVEKQLKEYKVKDKIQCSKTLTETSDCITARYFV